MKQIIKDVYIARSHDPTIPGCCVYMVDTKSEDGFVLIDVGLEIEYIQELKNDGFDPKDIKHCLITHGHIDHIGACHKLKDFNKEVKFYAHELDAEKIERTPKNQFTTPFYDDYEYIPVQLFQKINVDNEMLKLGDLEFKCIHIPGHTPGSVTYLLRKEGKNILFAGDLPGVVLNFRGGDLDSYLKSLPKLLKEKIDFLCEGHEDVIRPAEKVVKFIKAYMKLNEKLNLLMENPQDVELLLELTLISLDLELYENVSDFCEYLLEIDPSNEKALNLLGKIEKYNPPKIGFIKRLISESQELKK